MMVSSKVHFCLYIVVLATAATKVKGSSPNLSFEASICRLLNEKFVASHPWTIYPIVYEPIRKGRLTIWSGVSSLPTSEFKCLSTGKDAEYSNSTKSILLDFASFTNKLEWTFFDVNKGTTYHGYTINSCQDVKYKVSIKFRQASSYMECNIIDSITEINDNVDAKPHITTICNGCSQLMLAPIESQIKELIKQEIKEQILDNLYWQLAQLIINQHFHGPMPLDNNLD